MSTLKASNLQNAGSATVNLALDTNGNTTVAGTLSMGSSFARNRIINGGMDIWQRATAPAAGAFGSYTYNSADRWAFFSGTTSCSISQGASAPSGFRYSAKMLRTAASTGTGPFVALQVIESVNCSDLSGNSITLSFWAKAGANFSAASSLLSVAVLSGTTADQGSASLSWAGLATPIQTNVALTTTWTKYTLTGTVGAGVLEMAAQFSYAPTGTAGADDSFFITGVQLEQGSIATPFERRSYGHELALCQRYYFRTTPTSAGDPFGTGYASATTSAIGTIAFPVEVRSAPTALEQSGTATDYRIRSGSSTDTACSSVPTFAAATKTAAQVTFTVASGLTAGQGVLLRAATANGFLGWSAEL